MEEKKYNKTISVREKICFENDKYLKIEKEKILERKKLFPGKLYIEVGGKLLEDNHAARVLPGFKKDNKNDIKDIGIVKNMMAQVLEKSYSPYSKFKVGAILYTKDDKIYTGVNIENMGIQSICAERCAFSKAISSGVRKNEYSHIIICGINEKGKIEDITPCRIL